MLSKSNRWRSVKTCVLGSEPKTRVRSPCSERVISCSVRVTTVRIRIFIRFVTKYSILTVTLLLVCMLTKLPWHSRCPCSAPTHASRSERLGVAGVLAEVSPERRAKEVVTSLPLRRLIPQEMPATAAATTGGRTRSQTRSSSAELPLRAGLRNCV